MRARLSRCAPQGAYKPSEPAEFSVKIVNNGESPFYCDEVSGLPNAGMVLSLQDRGTGRFVEMTPRGANLFRRIAEVGKQVGLAKLAKGQEKTWTIDLGRLYDLKPGTFTLSASFLLRRDWNGHYFRVATGGALFTVAE